MGRVGVSKAPDHQDGETDQSRIKITRGHCGVAGALDRWHARHMATTPALTPSGRAVDDFIDSLPDEGKRSDARVLSELMTEITGEEATMWGTSIVGFGRYHYRYTSGREGDAPVASFAPRKQHLVVYLVSGFEDRHAQDLAKLGPHKAGKGCLYIKRLSDVDLSALRQLIDRSLPVRWGVDQPEAT
jgi:Domain of unknown function (DU1801)